MKLRAPAIPLITVDPYFSVWSPTTTLNTAPTMHWTGKPNQLLGIVTVDGKPYSFFGYHRDLHKMRQISLDIDALTTTVVLENDEIVLRAAFTTPLLPKDYHRLTRPVSYLSLSYSVKDGKAHEVRFNIRARETLCLNHAGQSPVTVDEVQIAPDIRAIRMGNSVQKPLHQSGDDVRIDWGYFYLAVAASNPALREKSYHGRNIEAETAADPDTKVLFLFAYDDIESIEYFGKPLRSFWRKDGMSIEAAIAEAAGEYEKVKALCDRFSQKLCRDAKAAGGSKYAELLALAYRQVIAAHKLVLDENGEILFISKECFSNGCAATVDISYPSCPMFLLYDPELIKGMLRPIYRYALSDAWQFSFAPHDVGQYPLLNGQVYGNNAPEMQMPVEECGNMLIMEAAVAITTGSVDFARSHMDTLKKWCGYLVKYGADPENQLCTDDFAGHLAHNCNLSLKAIMGIMGMSVLCRMNNDEKAAIDYHQKAKEMAAHWMENALDETGESRLAFDRPGTFAMKYNMVWDKLWNTGLFPDEFRKAELQNNRKHFNAYGLPLDSRADYTKSDWWIWVAAMTENKADFESFIAPLWQAYNDSESRVPLTDWFDTVSAREVSFQHRSVQGGLFMQLLMYRCKKK